MTTQAPVISITQLDKTYSNVQAVKGLSIMVGASIVCALVGLLIFNKRDLPTV